jgi:hypothetical protein
MVCSPAKPGTLSCIICTKQCGADGQGHGPFPEKGKGIEGNVYLFSISYMSAALLGTSYLHCVR